MSNLNDFDVVEELLEEFICSCTTISSDETFQEEEAHVASDAYCDEVGGCAICLEDIPFEDMAILKGCEHSYCACCILKWVTFHRDAPRVSKDEVNNLRMMKTT
eukprot:2879563-Pyramimonas_sp.AAC.1